MGSWHRSFTEAHVPNLAPGSLVEQAEGEIWSNPICTRDRLSGM